MNVPPGTFHNPGDVVTAGGQFAMNSVERPAVHTQLCAGGPGQTHPVQTCSSAEAGAVHPHAQIPRLQGGSHG